MKRPLRVLVLEADRGAAAMATEELTAAGHTVARCTEPDAPSFPCAGLSAGGDRCPLRAGQAVDVVLSVRRHPRAVPGAAEHGVMCALRQHIPLVVAGATTLNPFADWAAEALDRTFDVTDACERAAGALQHPHCERAASALRQTLDRAVRSPVPARVTVHRVHGRLRVRVFTPDPLDHTVRHQASVRIVAALRALDAHAAGIDVQFTASREGAGPR